MSAGSAGPSGVRNLRAMFETKNPDQSTSPPSRGRSSPNGSTSSAHSRPVSKVRSSFVAVERPGEGGQPAQWGLRKASDVSSMAEAREQAIMEEEGEHITAVSADKPSVSIQETTTSLGAILKGSPFESVPPMQLASTTQSAEKQTKLPTQGPTPTPTSSETPKINGSSSKIPSRPTKIQPKELNVKKAEAPIAQENKPVKVGPSTIDTKLPAPKSKESPTLLKKSPTLEKKAQDSPSSTSGTNSVFKPRGGVSKVLGVMQSANKAREERGKAESSNADATNGVKKPATVAKAPAVATKSTAASKTHAQKQEKPVAEPTQPKSPIITRSVKLPSAATATTAASAARQGGAETEESKPTSRDRKSINATAPRVANVATKAALAKKTSRASLANADDRARSRQSTVHKAADEGFLARMTRPTASSAQKAHDKVQTTANSPPRTRTAAEPAKKVARKSLNGTDSVHNGVRGKDDAKKGAGLAAKSAKDSPLSVLDDDEGEPGPAEVNDEYVSPQQAEVFGTASS